MLPVACPRLAAHDVYIGRARRCLSGRHECRILPWTKKYRDVQARSWLGWGRTSVEALERVRAGCPASSITILLAVDGFVV